MTDYDRDLDDLLMWLCSTAMDTRLTDESRLEWMCLRCGEVVRPRSAALAHPAACMRALPVEEKLRLMGIPFHVEKRGPIPAEIGDLHPAIPATRRYVLDWEEDPDA